MIRIVIGIAVGLAFAFLCAMLMEIAAHNSFASADMVRSEDGLEAVAALIGQLRLEGLLLVAASWFLGALAGGYIANLIAGRAIAGWLVAGGVIAAVLANIAAMPHPAWIMAAAVILPLLAGNMARRSAGVPFW